MDETETSDKIIKVRGVLEPIYYDELPIQLEYTNELEPNEIEIINGENGYKYTTKFQHTCGWGYAKKPTPTIHRESIYETFPSDVHTHVTNPNMTELDIEELEKESTDGIRVKNDPNIVAQYPHINPGQIIKEATPRVTVIPTNHIVKRIQNKIMVTDTNTIISPTSTVKLTVNELLSHYLQSKLYNIPIRKVQYKAKWYNGSLTHYEPHNRYKYQTPYAAQKENKTSDYYGTEIDITNVLNRETITITIRNLLLYIISKVTTPTTISVHFHDRIIVRIEPFDRQYSPHVLQIHNKPKQIPDKYYFKRKDWEKAYSEWAHAHRDLIRAKKLNAQFQIDEFWSADGNQVQTDKRIEPPEENVFICYINYHPESNDLKIGRSKNWESRYSLYTRANPPLKTIAPNCILRYYLKCPVHEDAIITEYLYSCMEDFFKNFSDNQSYLERHRSPTGHATEYYSIDTKLSMKDQLNEYVANLTEAFLDLTMQDLANIRQPAKNGDGIHGGKRQEFFNKVNRETKEHIYHVEEALQIVANLDNTTKFREYAIDFLPTFKN